jgi:hypothetical protein
MMNSQRPLDDATRKVRRPMHRLTEATLSVFDPPEDRSLAGVARFLLACRLEPAKPTAIVPDMPRNLTGGHVVRIGDDTRYIFEIVVIRDAANRCFGVYDAPPADLRTRLPELAVVDLARSRAQVTHNDGREAFLSVLSVDEVSHLIVLAQGPEPTEAGTDGLEDIEIVFEED